MGHDDIYALPLKKVGDFVFDERVVAVFQDMIERSVPGYSSILATIGEIAERYAQPHTNIFDLGCSLGAATRVIHPRLPDSCTIRAIDSSEPMIEEFKNRLPSTDGGARIVTECSDIQQVDIENASLTILNFTLQFIPVDERLGLLKKIAAGTIDGGALVLSEKIAFPDPHQQSLLSDLHHDFKRANGYSDLEIAQKRKAIENMMTPEYLKVHLERLNKVGFRTATCWFQCFNFVSIVAVK